ncbi:related to DNA repair/recombination protein Rec2 [Melanopsichium pennsylvanicum]|uniref:Related to DNA repair/recombination protein Rec2 n=1 Tax=Melanopsichium pennsylvanicum TaxID=63383 RepID=A0AAJ4XSN9_9BASI|nr:related to DNA repair/recombination protein Rec2 [Melanopsichium pennsylvanicum]
MTSLPIADLPWISKRIKACCRRANLFSTSEILLYQPQQLQQALRISQQDLDLLLLHVATASAPPPISVLDALNGNQPEQLNQHLFNLAPNHNGSSPDDSDQSDSNDPSNLARLSPSSIVPPTQGYDGNFPAADRYVYDSDSDSDSDSHVAAQSDDTMLHQDVDMPSTFRPAFAPHHNQQSHQAELPHIVPVSNAPSTTIPRDVLCIGRDRHVLTSGTQQLDHLLSGGFRSAVLTEIVGESGSGKTQMAIQACTFAALGFATLTPIEDQLASSIPSSDLHAFDDDLDLSEILKGYGMAMWTHPTTSHNGLGACYITSGGERAAHSIVHRALELADSAIRERFDRVYSATQSEQGSQHGLDRHVLLTRALELGRDQILRNLHVACVADVEALEHALKYSLPGLIARLSTNKNSQDFVRHAASSEIGIIVIDNLPSLFQQDPVAGDIDSLVQRSKMLVEIAEALNHLARPITFRVSPHANFVSSSSSSALSDRVVLIVNHVSDAFGVDKDVARRFVFGFADHIRLVGCGNRQKNRNISSEVYPDHAVVMEYATQSALVSGLLASVSPILVETIGNRIALNPTTTTNNNNNNDDDDDYYQYGGNGDGELRTVQPRMAQLGHTWTNLIQVRLFLSKTRSRVCIPTTISRLKSKSMRKQEGDKREMIRVRKVGVVMNPFGATMFEPFETGMMMRGDGSKKRERNFEVRQMRFVITSGKGIFGLDT